jgi:hypothetical protein
LGLGGIAYPPKKQGLTLETDGGRICEANEETACFLMKAVKKMQKNKSSGSGATKNARNGHSALPLMVHFQLGVDTNT